MKGHNLLFRLLLPVSLLAVSFTSLHAQCISGDCQNGVGTYRYADKSQYVGRFANGQREGKGKLMLSNGNTYEGQFTRNRIQGEGVMNYKNGDRYVGQWSSDQPNGKGKYYFKSRERYEGDFVNGEFDGQGTMYYPDGAYYTGAWKGNRKNGYGKLVFPDGTLSQGTWASGKLVNQGASNSNTANAQGQTAQQNTQKPTSAKPNIAANKNKKPDLRGLRNCASGYCRSGNGYYYYPDSSLWVGEFKEGYPSGSGACYYSNGDRYVGEWQNNAPYGEGIMYFASGRVYGAVWVNGSAVKELDSREEVPADPVRSEASRSVKIWAVVVGVGRYTAMPSLKFTDDDAYRFYSFLKSPEGGALPDNQITVLVDEAATRQNILGSMRQYFLRADENDVILLYFSGHGLEGCFLPVDYDGFNNKLRHEEIKQVFQQSKAKHKLCIADACHSGSLNYGIASKGPTQVSLQRYYQAFEDSEGGIALLMSSKAEELSLEDHGLRQGVFTYYVLQGLKGRADNNSDYLITIKELYHYVYAKVREYTAGAQTPVITGYYDDNMPVAVRQ